MHARMHARTHTHTRLCDQKVTNGFALNY